MRDKIIFLSCLLRLAVCNTWTDTQHKKLLFTRTAWDGTAPAQIDFVLTSQNLRLKEVHVDHHLFADSDHCPVCCTFVWPADGSSTERRCRSTTSSGDKVNLNNWKPDASWEEEIRAKLNVWPGSWMEASDALRDTASCCKHSTKEVKDPELRRLLDLKRNDGTPGDQRRALSNKYGIAAGT